MTDNELVTTLDFDDILCHLSKGDKISKDEGEQLASFIQKQVSLPKEKRTLEDLFAAYTVLVKSEDTKLSYLLELAFEIPDPLLICLALETLILKLNIYEPYIERLIQYSLGAPFDHDGDIRESAFLCIKHIYNQKKISSNILEKLNQVLLYISNDSEADEEIRDTANDLLQIKKLDRKIA